MAFNNNNNTSAAVPHKPTVGEKLSGTVESLVGKVTNNPTKVAEGEAKKTGEPLHAAHAGASQAVHGSNTHSSGSGILGNSHSSGPNHGTGAGLTGGNHNHHDHSSTGLTGNNHSSGLTGNNHSSGLTGNNSGLGNNATNDHSTLSHPTAGFTAGHTAGAPQDSSFGHNNHSSHGVAGSHGSALGHDNYGSNTGSGLTGNHGSSHSGAGLTGDHHTNKPSIGDKISGGAEALVGKATNNPAKVHEGEFQKTHDAQHAQAAAAQVGHNSTHGSTTGTGLGRDHNNATGFANNTTDINNGARQY